MIPVAFDGCFGWLHPGRGGRGVVLCAAFGHENMVAYRGWKTLAEKLASKGFHVLRFDYPGTGDSGGIEDDPDRLDAWRGSVVSATRYLQAASGADDIILVGLRLGATLALLASMDLDSVAGVACLAPILTGKSYLRELRLRANGWREANLHTADPHLPDHLDILGDRLSGRTLHELMQIDLGRLERCPEHVLLMGAGTGPIASAVSDKFRSLGCQLAADDFSGMSDFLEDSISSRMPHDTFERVVDWCSRLLPEEDTSSKSPVKTLRIADPIGLSDPGFIERAVSFGSSGHLAGILCQPEVDVARDATPVIMLNTGFGRRIGDGRVFTILARRLAAAGIPSLRMDLAGFGDSHAVGDDDPMPYDLRAPADVGSAIDLLEQAGHHNPHLVGICSGAFTAFHAAIQDSRVHGLVMVNTQMFRWKPGSSLRVVNKRQRRPSGFYLRAVIKRSAWRRLCRGEIAVGAILLVLCRRSLAMVGNRLLSVLERSFGWQTSAGQVSRWFRKLASRGVQVSLFYTEDDPGLAELALHFGKDGKHLRQLGNVRLHQLDNADHALFDRTARLAFVKLVVDLMRRQAPGIKAAPSPDHPASATIMS